MAVFNQNFYRVNSNNLALASSATGGTVDQPTEELGRLVLRPGTITCATNSTSVTGVSTAFSTNVQIGHVLQDAVGNNIGVVSSITNDTTLVLVSNAKVALTTSRYTSGNNTAILATDSFLMRIQVIKAAGNTSVTVPNITLLRTGNSQQVLNFDALTNKDYIEFFAEGVLGTADVSASPTSLDCSLQNYNISSEPIPNGIPNINLPIESLSGVINTANLAVSNFPTYLWYLINPLGNSNVLLATNTKYGLEVTDDLPSLTLVQGSGFVDPRTHYTFITGNAYRKY